MFTHIHTIEWNHIKQNATKTLNYFVNKVTGQILAELSTKGGFEYYLCTKVQMDNKTVGNYIGCVKSKETDGSKVAILVYDHDHQTEHNLSLNDESYL